MQTVKQVVKRFRLQRKENTTKYYKLNQVFLWTSPLFLILLCEFNHLQDFGALIGFIVHDFSVILFDTLLLGAVILTVLCLVKSGFIATFVPGLFLFIISFVEYYKYQSSGSHFVLTDLFMAGNTSQLMKFAGVQLNAYFIIDILIFITYFAVIFWFNPRIRFAQKPLKRLVTAVSCVLTVSIIVATPVSNFVYSAFALDNEEASNNYECDDKFKKNNLIAYLAQTSTEQILNSPEEPESYSENEIRKELQPAKPTVSDQKPNVVMIMSESFADFRRLDGIPNLDEYYQNFDQFAKEGICGNCVVPTFGNTTVRTEFELMFGLPMKSLNDSTSPQKMLPERETSQPTFADYYKSQGYSTTYIHPFLNSFYDRDQIYNNYNFDELRFQDDFKTDTTKFRQYIDDKSDFNEIISCLKQSEQPAYVYTSTMQNHQPYNLDSGMTEFEYYMAGIQQTDQALAMLMEQLKQLDEPTIVLFVGDHYPYFTDSSDSYDLADISTENAYVLYQQPFVIWNNYGASRNVEQTVSAFYLPHLIVQLTGGEQTPFISTMLDQMQTTPVYSSNYSVEIENNKVLDDLTYDRVLGKIYSRDSVNNP